jgi:general secretion pathway protein C
MSARWWTLIAWALAAASALFWGLKLFVPAAPLPPRTQVAGVAAAPQGDLTRLLGADPPPPTVAAEPAPDARYQLVGVVSPRANQAPREGLALIAVDGRPPKVFRVGAVVDGQNVLQTVGLRNATLGPRDGAALVALNIAPPPPAATGALPPAVIPTSPPPPPPVQAPPRMQSPPQAQAPRMQQAPAPRRAGGPAQTQLMPEVDPNSSPKGVAEGLPTR